MCALEHGQTGGSPEHSSAMIMNVLWVAVEGNERSILLRLLRLGLPAGSRDSLGIEGRLRVSRAASMLERIHVGLLLPAHPGSRRHRNAVVESRGGIGMKGVHERPYRATGDERNADAPEDETARDKQKVV